MKRILRSVIDFETDDSPDSRDLLAENLKELVEFPLDWPRVDDKALYEYVLMHFKQFLEVPSYKVVADYFERADDPEALSRLKEVAASQLYTRSGFRYLLERTLEEQNTSRLAVAGREFLDILQKGLDVRDGRKTVRKKGVTDAVEHLALRMQECVVKPKAGVKLSGDIREDGEEVWKDHERAATDRSSVYGRLTGLNEIDVVNRGLRPGELWIHGGYPGELKTTFAENWAYNQVVHYKTSIVYWAFEQKYEQLRRHIYVIHSSHPRFTAMGFSPLDDRKVRDGELDAKEVEA
jgi:replicative DNA helicase